MPRAGKTAGLAVAFTVLLAGCGPVVTYVTASDPVLRICQSADVQNIDALQVSVDNANSASDWSQQLVPDQAAALKRAAAGYRVMAGETSHRGFAAALRGAAQEFSVAAASPTGMTTNTVASAADKFSGEIQDDCNSFTVGTVPKAGKPGPGVWDWGLFGIVLGGYLLMMLIAGYLIAVAQRSKPRKKRLGPGPIFWLSTVWWVTIFTAIGGVYRHALAGATLTRDEKKDDRLAALAKENARLEAQLKRPIES